MKFSPSPAKVHELTHAVSVSKGNSGGALQGSWDVPSAHAIDRTSSQYSVTDQFGAATSIQRVARGQVTRQHDPHSAHFQPGEATIYDLSAQLRATGTGSMLPGEGRVQPGKASESFEARDAYAVSPYGEGYGFVNNPHDQFGSTAGFNESKTSALADPKPTAQMRVKSGYTGHVPKGRDHVGSTYRMHDNRGTAGKTMVPIPHQDISPPVDEVLAKSKRNLTYLAGLSATETIAGADNQATINVPVRVQKIMEDPNYYVKGTESLHMKKYPEAKNPMTGYTGHVPFARDVVGTTFYGPTEGNNHHGPAMEADPAGFVRATNPNKFSESP